MLIQSLCGRSGWRGRPPCVVATLCKGPRITIGALRQSPLQVLATVPSVRALFVEHLAMQWDFGIMSSEEVDACLVQVQQKANALRGWQPPQEEDAASADARDYRS